jgi:hypothetical protein
LVFSRNYTTTKKTDTEVSVFYVDRLFDLENFVHLLATWRVKGE